MKKLLRRCRILKSPCFTNLNVVNLIVRGTLNTLPHEIFHARNRLRSRTRGAGLYQRTLKYLVFVMQPTDMKRPKRSFPAEISICASTSIVIYDLHSILHNLGGEAGLPLPCPSFLENESALERYRVTVSFSQMGFVRLLKRRGWIVCSIVLYC